MLVVLFLAVYLFRQSPESAAALAGLSWHKSASCEADRQVEVHKIVKMLTYLAF